MYNKNNVNIFILASELHRLVTLPLPPVSFPVKVGAKKFIFRIIKCLTPIYLFFVINYGVLLINPVRCKTSWIGRNHQDRSMGPKKTINTRIDQKKIPGSI